MILANYSKTTGTTYCLKIRSFPTLILQYTFVENGKVENIEKKKKCMKYEAMCDMGFKI